MYYYEHDFIDDIEPYNLNMFINKNLCYIVIYMF